MTAQIQPYFTSGTISASNISYNVITSPMTATLGAGDKYEELKALTQWLYETLRSEHLAVAIDHPSSECDICEVLAEAEANLG